MRYSITAPTSSGGGGYAPGDTFFDDVVTYKTGFDLSIASNDVVVGAGTVRTFSGGAWTSNAYTAQSPALMDVYLKSGAAIESGRSFAATSGIGTLNEVYDDGAGGTLAVSGNDCCRHIVWIEIATGQVAIQLEDNFEATFNQAMENFVAGVAGKTENPEFASGWIKIGAVVQRGGTTVGTDFALVPTDRYGNFF